MRIVWIASYPKSGNTWVRFLLANYFLGEVRSSQEVARCIPDVHVRTEFPPPRKWVTPARGHLLVKTHMPFKPSHPSFQATAGFIYVLRNPKDILLSSLNYRRMPGEALEKAVGKFSDEQYARGFIEAGGDPIWKNVGFGTWEDHVGSWLGQTSIPHVPVRYRDLRSRPAESLRAMLEMLGEPVDEPRMESAIRNSSFERMREMEVRERQNAGAASKVFGGDPATMRQDLFFMNKGAIGASLAGIAPNLDRDFDQRFGAPSRRLGLEPEAQPGTPGVSPAPSPNG